MGPGRVNFAYSPNGGPETHYFTYETGHIVPRCRVRLYRLRNPRSNRMGGHFRAANVSHVLASDLYVSRVCYQSIVPKNTPLMSVCRPIVEASALNLVAS